MADGLTSVAVFCWIPVGVLGLLVCHELGPALPVLLAGGRPHITIGSDEGRTVRFGRLSITGGLDGLWRLFTYGGSVPPATAGTQYCTGEELRR